MGVEVNYFQGGILQANASYHTIGAESADGSMSGFDDYTNCEYLKHFGVL